MLCPICKKSVTDQGDNRPPTYPFCSDRCKLIDLGRWLSGKYQIPISGPEDSADDDDSKQRPEAGFPRQ